MINTIYVVVRVDHEHARVNPDRNIGVEALAYTDSKHSGTTFLEMVTSKDVCGKDWDPSRDGDPFYDPENTDDLPPPDSIFPVWDTDIEPDDPILDRPSSVVASTSIFSARDGSENRRLLRSYKLCRANVMVDDFKKAFTEGDKEMFRQIAMNGAPPLP